MGLLGDAFGVFTAGKQEDDEYGRYQDYLGLGNFYRQLLKDTYKPGGIEGWMSGPEVSTPVNMGTKSLLGGLSTQGNPFGSGRALQEAQDWASKQFYDRLGGYRNQLQNFGNTGLQAAFAQGNRQLDAQKDVYNSYGSLINNGENALMTLFAGGAGSGAPPGMGTGATAANVDFLPW